MVGLLPVLSFLTTQVVLIKCTLLPAPNSATEICFGDGQMTKTGPEFTQERKVLSATLLNWYDISLGLRKSFFFLLIIQLKRLFPWTCKSHSK